MLLLIRITPGDLEKNIWAFVCFKKKKKKKNSKIRRTLKSDCRFLFLFFFLLNHSFNDTEFYYFLLTNHDTMVLE